MCDLFIFNKVNSRLSLESHFLPNIPGCSPETSDYRTNDSPLAAVVSLENMEGEVVVSKPRPWPGPRTSLSHGWSFTWGGIQRHPPPIVHPLLDL